MTDIDKIKFVQTKIEDTSEATKPLIDSCLKEAKQMILDHRYPYGVPEGADVSRWDMKQCEIAIVLYNRIGVEGETSHNENGVQRVYADADCIHILNGIPTVCGMPG